MIYLIHGEDIVSSRKKLTNILEKYEGEVTHLDGAKVQLDELVLLTDTQSLLSTKRVIVIENLLVGGVKKQKHILEYIAKDTSVHSIIIWEKKQISKTIQKKYFSKAKEVSYSIPRTVFAFLDSYGRSSGAQFIRSFHTVLENEEAEFIYAMLVRQIRLLIMVKDLGVSGDHGITSWQAQKYARQSSGLSLAHLIGAYRALLAIDVKIKTGMTPYTMRQHLDIFFLSH